MLRSPHFEILAVDLNSAVLALPPRLYRRHCNVKTNNNFDLSLTFFCLSARLGYVNVSNLGLSLSFSSLGAKHEARGPVWLLHINNGFQFSHGSARARTHTCRTLAVHLAQTDALSASGKLRAADRHSG